MLIGGEVALLAEGVDRNFLNWLFAQICELSPSSRRAWIEIPSLASAAAPTARVALLTEGVDRNARAGGLYRSCRSSPSSRRAWIEIRKAPS